MEGVYLNKVFRMSDFKNCDSIMCRKILIDDYKPGKWYAREFEFSDYVIYYEMYFLKMYRDMEFYTFNETQTEAITPECSLLQNTRPYQLPYLTDEIYYATGNTTTIQTDKKIAILAFPNICHLETIQAEVVEIRNFNVGNVGLMCTASEYINDTPNSIRGYIRDNPNIRLIHINYPTKTFCKFLTSGLEKFYIHGVKQDIFKLTIDNYIPEPDTKISHKIILDPYGLYDETKHNCSYIKTTNPSLLLNFGVNQPDTDTFLNIEFGFFPNVDTIFRAETNNTFPSSGYLAVVIYIDPIKGIMTQTSTITAKFIILNDTDKALCTAICYSGNQPFNNTTHYFFSGPGVDGNSFDMRGRGTTGSKSGSGSANKIVKFVCLGSCANFTSMSDVNNYGAFEGASNLYTIVFPPELITSTGTYQLSAGNLKHIFFSQTNDVSGLAYVGAAKKHFVNYTIANNIYNRISNKTGFCIDF